MKKKIISIPPNYFYACIILNIIFYFIFRDFNLVHFPFNLTGIVFIIPGFYLLIKSYYLFKEKNTPEKFLTARCLVCEGLYKYSRNPMYLGGCMILLGFAVTMTNIIALILPILFFIVMNFMFIPYEEEKMANEIGEEYFQYKKRVRRWV